MKDPYSVLGVSPQASEEEIKTAYRELVKKYHPDNYNGNPLEDLAKEKMAEINAAYDEIIKNKSYKGSSSSNYGSYSGSGEFAEIRNMIYSNNIQKAIEMLNRIPGERRNAEWNFLMGSAYYKKGWVNDARTYFQTACTMDPGNTEYAAAYNNLNHASQQYGNYGQNMGMCGSGSGCECCAQLMCLDCLCDSIGGGGCC